MDLEQFAFPFSVGMLAAFNPCGFAMLPTYIGYFIGTGEAEQPTRVRAVTRTCGSAPCSPSASWRCSALSGC